MGAIQIAIDESVIEDVISRFGLRMVHIMRYGQPTNDFAWSQKWIAEKVPDHAREFVFWRVSADQEAALQYWHLFIYWNAREMVEFSPRWKGAELRYGVLWYIPQGKGETASFSVDVAATLYRLATGRKATHAWLRDVPVSKRVVIQAQDGPVALTMGCEWVPQHFVVVGRPSEEWDPVYRGGRYE